VICDVKIQIRPKSEFSFVSSSLAILFTMETGRIKMNVKKTIPITFRVMLFVPELSIIFKIKKKSICVCKIFKMGVVVLTEIM
jgi:hypothetical protein